MTNPSDAIDRKALLKNALAAINELQEKVNESERAAHEPIAITGMGCRFPGDAINPEAFWDLLHNGVDAVRPVPPDRWDTNTFADLKLAHPIAWFGGFINKIDQFDPQFFGISPREANSIDPQQRLVLEVTWEALENAGQAPDELLDSQTGVFMGATTNDYAQMVRSGDPALMDVYAATGSAMNVISGRVAYLLGLHGPSLTVDTACSSSLVAIHLACRSLRSRECDLALAGGVNATLTPEAFICFAGWGMMAPDGHCKTFDAGANGFVRGEGCGVLVLKRLSDAVAAGDRILAVIRGSAVNQDGRSSGLTVPNGRAQQAVIRTALRDAGVEPSQVSYVETHGTGTSLGDPIEIEALGAALGPGRGMKPLIVGSVKTNIGHLESASGVAGLIKSVLALRHEEIPPHLHLKERSQRIPWPEFPIEISSNPIPWPASDNPRIAGVSSFGFGGTNAHIVLEEAPHIAITGQSPEYNTNLLILSAKSQNALVDLAGRYAQRMTASLDFSPTLACRTASTGRQHFSYRLAVIGNSSADIAETLTAFSSGDSPIGSIAGEALRGAPQKIAFLFTGQGSQWVGMGQQLYTEQPVFREALDQCDALLRPYLDVPLLSILFPDVDAAPLLDHTTYTQPAIFALQYALTKLWQSWGIEPFAVLGHSLGEYAAACTAGVFSLEDGLKIIVARGRLMGSLPEGGQMAAVFASEDQVSQILTRLGGQVSIAAINGPENIVISGGGASFQAAFDAFDQADIQTRQMNVSHAFHSMLMDSILDEFEQAAGEIQYNQPQVQLISNVTGQMETGRILTPHYWREHIRQPVRFYQGIQSLYEQGCRVFIEIGPNPVLIGMAQRCLPETDKTMRWLPSLRKGRPDLKQTLESLGVLWTLGTKIDWKSFYRDLPGQPVELPTYPFQYERYWLPTQESYHNLAQNRVLSENQQSLFLTHRVDLATQDSDNLWEGEVSFDAFPYLRDHCVQGTAILPASAYVEIALEAAYQIWDSDGFKLVNVENRKVLLLRENEAFSIQVVFSQQPEGQTLYQIFSRPKNYTHKNIGWTLNHIGSISPMDKTNNIPGVPDLLAIRSRFTQEISVSTFYQSQYKNGNQWGPAFQGMVRLWRGNSEAFSQIDAPEGLDLDHAYFHPALADASGHSLVAALPSPELGNNLTGAFVGGRIDEIRFYRKPKNRRIWSHAEFFSKNQEKDNNVIGNVRVWDDDGDVISETIGAHLYYFDQDAQQALFSPIDDWFYSPTWQEAGVFLSEKDELTFDISQQWVIFADDLGVGEALAKKILTAGGHPILIFHGEDRVRASVESYTLPLHQPDRLESILREISIAREAPVSKIIFCWGLDTPQPHDAGIAELEAAEGLGCESILNLVQALAKISVKAPPKIWLVTRNARWVTREETDLAPAQALIWGFGLSLAGEHSDLWGGLVDLENAASPDQAAESLLIATGETVKEDQVAFRDGKLFITRLTRKQDIVATNELQCRPDGAYLITGGLGGLGQMIAHRLLERGARCLLLTGRASLPERSEWGMLDPDSRQAQMVTAIRDLEATGATILYFAADAGDERQMRRVLVKFRQQGNLPIRGVIHTAGVPQYQPILEHSVKEMRKVLRPKVNGAWLLHYLLQDDPLEFFVMFSSASTLLSSPLAASYAAGNAFLDTLAHFRKVHGMPALSINWGFWSEAGMVANFTKSNTSARSDLSQAMKMIPSQQGLRALEVAMGQEDAQIGIFPVDWNKWVGLLPNNSFISELIQQKPNSKSSVSNQTISSETIRKAVPEERSRILGEYLAKLVAQILGLPVTKLSQQEPITNLGIDSLMALEIKNKIDRDLQLAIPVMDLLKGPSITNLVETLGEKLANEVITGGLVENMTISTARSVQTNPIGSEKILTQSYNQRTMWFLNLVAPNSSAYNVGFAAYIRSLVNIPSLHLAVKTLI